MLPYSLQVNPPDCSHWLMSAFQDFNHRSRNETGNTYGNIASIYFRTMRLQSLSSVALRSRNTLCLLFPPGSCSMALRTASHLYSDVLAAHSAKDVTHESTGPTANLCSSINASVACICACHARSTSVAPTRSCETIGSSLTISKVRQGAHMMCRLITTHL